MNIEKMHDDSMNHPGMIHPMANGNELMYRKQKLGFQEWDKALKREEQITEGDFLEQFYKDVLQFISEGENLEQLKQAKEQAHSQVNQRKNKNPIVKLFQNSDKTLQMEIDLQKKGKAFWDASQKRELQVQEASAHKFMENPTTYERDYEYQYNCLVAETGLIYLEAENQTPEGKKEYIQGIGKSARRERIENAHIKRDQKFRDLEMCAFWNKDNVLPDFRELVENIDMESINVFGFYHDKQGTDKKTRELERIDKEIIKRNEKTMSAEDFLKLAKEIHTNGIPRNGAAGSKEINPPR